MKTGKHVLKKKIEVPRSMLRVHVLRLFLVFFFLETWASRSLAEVLSPLALFNRCYTQITLLPLPPRTDPRVAAVVAGTRQATDACMDVLEEALLTGGSNTVIGNVGNMEARAVIRNFHNLHASWFSVPDFPLVLFGLANNATKNNWDATAPAAYFTRALLLPSGQARSIVTEPLNLRPRRANMNVTASLIGNVELSDTVSFGNSFFRINPDFRFAGIGDILGVQPTGALNMNYSYMTSANSSPTRGTVSMGATLGGGFLGTSPFLIKAVGEENLFRANGAEQMPRKWSKAILNDLLCRELPVARLSDAESYTVADGPGVARFRSSASCVRCHMTMDQMAGTLRGFHYNSLYDFHTLPIQIGGDFPDFYTVSKPATSDRWPATIDTQFHLRPPSGSLTFRSYDGTFIDRPLTTVANLGATIADTNDFYVCLASRYYKYFTGISVTLADLTDPVAPITLTPRAAQHRSTIIQLGLQLKSHQSLRRTIEEIIKLPIYRESNLGI